MSRDDVIRRCAMSMHKIPLTEVERDGLKKHGLPIDKPSQLSDAFRQGVAHGAAPSTSRPPIKTWEDRYDPQGFTRGAPRTIAAAMRDEIIDLRARLAAPSTSPEPSIIHVAKQAVNPE